MKAAVVHSFTEPLTVDEVATPEPGPEQVLVRIETCSVHSKSVWTIPSRYSNWCSPRPQLAGRCRHSDSPQLLVSCCFCAVAPAVTWSDIV